MTTTATTRSKSLKTRDIEGPDSPVARLLLAQDDPDARREIAAWLAGAGYDVRLCDSSKKTVDMVHVIEPDLLVIDFTRPPSDTIDVCRMLRQDTASPLASRL